MRLIDADELLGNIFFVEDEEGYMTTVVAKEDIESAPTVEASPVVHGRWGNYEPHLNGYRCSFCKITHRTCTRYCPNCGAKMDLPEDGE